MASILGIGENGTTDPETETETVKTARSPHSHAALAGCKAVKTRFYGQQHRHATVASILGIGETGTTDPETETETVKTARSPH